MFSEASTRPRCMCLTTGSGTCYYCCSRSGGSNPSPLPLFPQVSHILVYVDANQRTTEAGPAASAKLERDVNQKLAKLIVRTGRSFPTFFWGRGTGTH